MLDHNAVFAALDALSNAKTDTDFFTILEQHSVLLDPALDIWLNQFILQAQTDQQPTVVAQFQQMQVMLKDIREQCAGNLSDTQELMQAVHALALVTNEAQALKIFAAHPILQSPDTYTFLDKIIPEMERAGEIEQANLFKQVKAWLLSRSQKAKVH